MKLRIVRGAAILALAWTAEIPPALVSTRDGNAIPLAARCEFLLIQCSGGLFALRLHVAVWWNRSVA